ncbi:MAG: Nitric oxide reductase [Syntrophus sp. SKADARSKE-3]|nr:Nitric oxide reductase [Syntrophus sp. SKADARSKE-3]
MEVIYKAVRLTDKVFWVGAIDWTIRDFHGYMTKRGSTYNAYLIMAEKITLIDTVKAPFREELLSRIASVVNPADIDIIVSNHSEMDHSGCLREIIDLVKPEKVYASAMGAKTLGELFHFSAEITPVKDGQTISLGNMNLTFMETRMLHWPDSMISYLHEDHILFSQDAFGMHLATSERFDDEIDPAVLQYEGATYFANILLPYANLIGKLADKIMASGWTIKMVAPDHGPVWRKDIGGAIENYGRWAAQKPAAKAVVVYGTMWHSTELMARHIGEGMTAGGVTVKVMSMDASHRSDVVYEILDAGAFVAGSATLNNQMLPGMADILTYLKGLRPANLIGAAFGSYGWSGEAAGQIMEIMQSMKIEPVGEVLRVKHVPDREVLAGCYAIGESIARMLHQKIKS